MRERQEHRRRIARLAAGDNLVLPPEAVAYVEHLRSLGFPWEERGWTGRTKLERIAPQGAASGSKR